MKLIVNGTAVESAAVSLADVLDDLGKSDAKVATAVNEAFVPAGQRGTHILHEGDRIEIVAPRQGG